MYNQSHTCSKIYGHVSSRGMIDCGVCGYFQDECLVNLILSPAVKLTSWSDD